ncbi:MAG: PspC domain-containing protein, partial [Elusimicrobiaceae bacterium]
MDNQNMRRLYRLDNDKVFFGILSGFGDYFRVDPALIRVIFLFSVFIGAFIPVLAYLLGPLFIPKAPAGYAPYQGARKFYRSRSNKIIFGIFGQLGNYLNVDPTILRVIFVVVALLTGIGVLGY